MGILLDPFILELTKAFSSFFSIYEPDFENSGNLNSGTFLFSLMVG